MSIQEPATPVDQPVDDALPLSRDEIVRAMARVRELHDWDRDPEEGLRERKKRLTRQLISDTATWLFCERGFDAVRVSEIADEAGVSEKTVFNYFPTKESLVLDRQTELLEGVRAALTDRADRESPTEAMVGYISRELALIDQLGVEFQPLFLRFMRLVEETPALRTAQQELAAKLVAVAREALAERAGVDPQDPEPRVAAHALVALWEVQLSAGQRYMAVGGAPDGLKDAVLGEVRRAARLLDTGLWSFNSVAQGTSNRSQLADAAQAANEARKQVLEALRQARAAWSEVRRAGEEAHRSADGTWPHGRARRNGPGAGPR